MGQPQFHRKGKWNIIQHTVSRFRTRVDPHIKRKSPNDVRAKIAHALNHAVEVGDVFPYDPTRSIIYRVHFSYRSVEYGPYYCVGKSAEPAMITTLLDQENMEGQLAWHGHTIDDLIGD